MTQLDLFKTLLCFILALALGVFTDNYLWIIVCLRSKGAFISILRRWVPTSWPYSY